MKITTVILDWAGTTVDYGSFAPVDAFIAAFSAYGIVPTLSETRAPMGMSKRAHIEEMLNGERLSAAWCEKRGTAHTQADIDALYELFEPALFENLPKYAELLPRVPECVSTLRDMGLKIGSTTGYTRAMMDVVASIAKEKGYAPDCIICPEEAGGSGRPYPYMLWRNLEVLKTESIGEAIKVGDTEADIREGVNAGCVSVGVIAGSSMLAIKELELPLLSGAQRRKQYEDVRDRYYSAGADYVIDDISQLPTLIEKIGDQYVRTYTG